jgi:hypothetical protein
MLQKLNTKRMNNPINKWASFQKKYKWLTNTKKYSTSLVIKEMQIKTSLRFHLTPVSLLLSRKQKTNNASKDVGETRPLHTFGENVNQCNHYGNQYEVFFKIQK